MNLFNGRSVIGNKKRRRLRYRALRDRMFLGLFIVAVMAGITGLITLLATVIVDAWGWVDWQFITSYASRFPDKSGILAPLMGTVWIIGTTIIFTIPIGVGTAIFLEEFSDGNKLSKLIQINISNLAGVPSIVYGILGLGVFVMLIGLGRSVLAGGLTLSLLVMPIVIIASQEAIRAVPSGYRDAAYAMGATRWQVVKSVVMPEAIPGIMSGIILAISRAIGEAAPILMISGIVYITFVPNNVSSSFTVLPLQIMTWATLPQADFQSIAAAAILVLLVVLLTLNASAIWIRNKFQRRRE